MTSASRLILTVNPGSSSLKAAVYRMDTDERLELGLEVASIGTSHASLTVTAPGDQMGDRRDVEAKTHADAFEYVLAELSRRKLAVAVMGIGQRVVHGGPRYTEPTVVTAGLITYLRQLVSLDPTHLPQSIAVIEATRQAFPGVPQVACFDTAFHATLPPVAREFPLPRAYTGRGIRRYGFHGLSYEYLMDVLRSKDPGAAMGRVVMAHLGNGASMAAVNRGVCIDTTMGLTPAGGLMMGTRTGDLDPGVLLALLDTGLSPTELSRVVNEQSGLEGVSGTSHDVRELLAASPVDEAAAHALDMFCYAARKFVGALAAALGGLDTLVFTGGIGEHAAPIRSAICRDLTFLGIELDSGLNNEHAAVISSDGSRVAVRIIPTNEDLVVARHVVRCLAEKGT